jgi:hypothetical protein
MSIQKNFIPSLSKPNTRILIGVPCKDMMYSHFAYCLQEIVEYHSKRNIETIVEFNMGTLIGSQRERIADRALELGVTHILWLDSDMMFPRTICETLLSHNLDFVACNYATRSLPRRSVAYSEIGNWDSYLGKDEIGLIAAEGVGLGCALLKVSILSDIPKPWFPITYNTETNDYLGEDFNFCQKISYFGYPIAIDCDASREVYHIGSVAFEWKLPDKLEVDNLDQIK